MAEDWEHETTKNGTPLATRIERISTQLETMQDTHRWMRNAVWGLAGIGVGALVLAGAYMQQVDDLRTGQQQLRQEVRQLQIDYAGRTELGANGGPKPWKLSRSPKPSSTSPSD